MRAFIQSVQQLDWRQPWGWPRVQQRLVWAFAGVVGAVLLSPWWLSSWQLWDEARQAQAQLVKQQQATTEMRVQTAQLLQAATQMPIQLAPPQVLTQLAQQQGLHLVQVGLDKPQNSTHLHALHLQQLPVHLSVQGSWDGWLKWLAQWPSAAPGVTVASLELKADSRGGISAQMLAVAPQSTQTQAPFELANVDADVADAHGMASADPFSAHSWTRAQRIHAAQHPSYSQLVAPELTRSRDVLEAFARERLQYVGQIASGGEVEGLVRVLPLPSGDGVGGGLGTGAKQDPQMMSVYRVRVGSYLGQDFGKVLAVHPDVLWVQELAVMPTGEWQTRDVRLPLREAGP